MRAALGVTILLAASAAAQLPDDRIPARFGVAANSRGFPQDTPQKALASAIKAIEFERFDYLLAHLLDPTAVDAKITDRAPSQQPTADRRLRDLRNRQKADPLSYTPEERLPDEPEAFAARVATAARELALTKLGGEVQAKFAGDAAAVGDLKRFLREGTVAVTGDAAKLTLKGDAVRAVYFKRAEGRWFVEDRQGEK